jgi:hypothetical protein
MITDKYMDLYLYNNHTFILSRKKKAVRLTFGG